MDPQTFADLRYARAKLRAGLRIIDNPFGSNSTWYKFRRAWARELSLIDPELHLDAEGREQFTRAIDTLKDMKSDDHAVKSAIEELRQLRKRLKAWRPSSESPDTDFEVAE